MLSPDAVNAMIEEYWPDASVTCESVDPTQATASIQPGPRALRPGGFISGPTQFAGADAALWFLVCGVLGHAEPMALTSELSIRYLRPAVGARLWARATLDRAGKRTVVATVRVWTDDNEDRPCAVAQGSYVVPES